MIAADLATALRPTIQAALASTFADDIARDDSFPARVEKLAAALAQGIAAGLVPYLTDPAQTTVVDVAGSPLGALR